jgi:hypothetical protein
LKKFWQSRPLESALQSAISYEASLIAELIRRDLPYYDPSISREFVAGMTEFQRHVGLLDRDVSYEDVVATRFSSVWAS